MLRCTGESPRNVYGNQGFPDSLTKELGKKNSFKNSLIGIVFLGKISGGKERKIAI